jgi:hypothetical protein
MTLADRNINGRYPINQATMIAAQTIRKWLEAPVDPKSSDSPPNASIVRSLVI